MGIFGAKQNTPPPHPRREPRFAGPLTADAVAEVFARCADFNRRTLYLNNDPARQVEMLFIAGQVRTERACDYVLRPLTQNEALRRAPDMDAAFDLMQNGGLYSLSVQCRDTMDQVIFDLIDGSVALFFPAKEQVLTLAAGTEEKRSVSDPENEPDVKGARDSFVESLRTNTSLVRRRFRAPELKIEEQIVGRQSITPVDVLYVDGIADPALAEQVKAKLEGIDIDALLMTGSLEQYVVDESHTAFPLTAYTERPDRFCTGLAEGRVGVLVDGIPMGWLFPATLDSFFRTGQDRSTSWAIAGALSVLRYVCMLITLFLPGLYVAAVLFHPELIPVKLTLSIIAAKADVPFSRLTEVLTAPALLHRADRFHSGRTGGRLGGGGGQAGQSCRAGGGGHCGHRRIHRPQSGFRWGLTAVAVWADHRRGAAGFDRSGAGRSCAGLPSWVPGDLRRGLSDPLCLGRGQAERGTYSIAGASAGGQDPSRLSESREQEESGVKKWLLLVVAGAVLLVGWRPAPREPDRLALVRVLGVDGSGPLTLTAVCGGEDAQRGQCGGEDWNEALDGLPWSGQEELSLTSVSYIVVSEDVDLEQTLLTVLRNEELGASASIWMAGPGAAELLGGCEDPQSALDLLARQGADAPTAAQALAALYENSAVELPRLDLEEKGLVWLGQMRWEGKG